MSYVTVVQLVIVLAAEVDASLVEHRIGHSSVVYSVLAKLGRCLSFGYVRVCDVAPQKTIETALMNTIIRAGIEELVGCCIHVCIWSVPVMIVAHFKHLVVVRASHM